jgi:large subunit ribosomal protein L4
MPTVKVRNLKNEEVGEVELSDAVFGAPLNEALIHAAVRNYMANARQGTSATKTRGDVSGAGRKLWKQKGTGRARIASLRSPLWKGGGNAHGPQPRDWSYNMPKKMRHGALRSALSERVREGKVVLVDGWSIDKPKTKEFVGTLKQLGNEGKTLIVDSLDNENLLLSTRNVRSTKVVNSFGLNIYDLLYHDSLIISEAAVKELEQLLGSKENARSGDETEPVSETAVSPQVSEAATPADGKGPIEAAPAKPKRARKGKAELAEATETSAEEQDGGDEK